MARRVRDFCRANPAPDANYAPMLARLEDRVARMEGLARQQQDGYLVRASSTTRRRELRRRITYELLRHLATVAGLAATEQPALVRRFDASLHNVSNEAFRALARRLLELGRQESEILLRHGLAETLLDDLAAALDEFDASLAASNEARREHVGARADLETVSDEVMRLVDVLDGINRCRFPAAGELRAAWVSARRVTARPRAADEAAEETADAPQENAA